MTVKVQFHSRCYEFVAYEAQVRLTAETTLATILEAQCLARDALRHAHPRSIFRETLVVSYAGFVSVLVIGDYAEIEGDG